MVKVTIIVEDFYDCPENQVTMEVVQADGYTLAERTLFTMVHVANIINRQLVIDEKITAEELLNLPKN